MIHAAPGTIIIYSDLVCSFAHLAVHRLHRTRAELGLEAAVAFDHRAFPLELFNEQVNPRPGVDSEIAVLGGLAPEAGWAMWHAPDWAYPSTVLPALEAVQGAKEQSGPRARCWISPCGGRSGPTPGASPSATSSSTSPAEWRAETCWTSTGSPTPWTAGEPATRSSRTGGPREAARFAAPLTCSCPTARTSRTRASPPAGSTATSASGLLTRAAAVAAA